MHTYEDGGELHHENCEVPGEHSVAQGCTTEGGELSDGASSLLVKSVYRPNGEVRVRVALQASDGTHAFAEFDPAKVSGEVLELFVEALHGEFEEAESDAAEWARVRRERRA